ncbi:MAG TPA: type III pantothenate kinase [Abditibacteriaceae bacterium]|jgi:type III pantothenate kinase|nr:type III pantothenate kinase [Abditibacteriaceae bacterium]
MLLVLDIGNTNITCGVWRDDVLAAQWRFSSQRERTGDELGALLKTCFDLENLRFREVTGVAICSVVPPLTPQIVQMSTRFFDCDALIVDKTTETGLINDYNPPEAVGADRLVNALAAREKFKSACLIVDFGTATTVDAVSHDGHYLGGAIAPGLGIASDALYTAAAKLPRVELKAPNRALARDTTSSMQSGLVFGYAGLVKELVERCTHEMAPHLGANRVLETLATGGLAEIIAPLVPAIGHIEPHLTLEGLRLLWRQSH